jgi:hypothetical protein
MPFSREQLHQVQAGLERALSSGALNDWERKFLIDMKSKLQRQGTQTILSDKQYAKLMQLAGVSRTYIAQSPPPRAISTFRPNIKGRTTSRIPYWVRREVRWFSRRMLWNFSVFLALLAVGGIFAIGQKHNRVASSSSTGPSYVARELRTNDISVVDGDTINISGETRSIRLVGFNTPEVSAPGCTREEQLGNQATARLSDLLRTATSIEYEQVRCSCPPGTEGTSECNFGRGCGTLRVDGRDVGSILISEGLAVRYVCGPTSCPPRPGAWCDG